MSTESPNVVPYREPPRVVLDVLDAPPTPWISLSPDAAWILFVEHAAMPALADVARPLVRVAGVRIDPTTDAHHQTVFGTGLVLRALAGGRERRVALPRGGRVSSIRWSHDARRFACLLVDCDGAAGTSLWTADVDDLELARVVPRVNVTLSDGYEWMPDGRRLLVAVVPHDRGPAPVEPSLPRGPKVLEARGDTTPLRTYQDLLSSEHDELAFEHHARVELCLCDPLDGSVERLGPDGGRARIVWGFDASPDGRWVLVTTVERPYSYLHPFSGFPQSIEAWSVDGARHVVIARVPTAENVPIEGVRTGPRHVVWSAHGPESSRARPVAAGGGGQHDASAAGGATLTWLEALDGGDPRRAVPHRDRWMELDAPFDGAPREVLRIEHRASGLGWLADPSKRLVRDYDRDRRWTRLSIVDPSGAAAPVVLDDRSVRDRHGDPGSVLFEPRARGRRIVRQRGPWIFRFGDGETPEGPRPFVDRQHLGTLARERMFQGALGEVEAPQALVEDARGEPIALVTRHESPVCPPNLRWRRLVEHDGAPRAAGVFEALTSFPDPAPILRRVRRETITYARADGVTLSGDLYLPPDWKGERLPIVLWAYPHDFVDSGTASQVTAQSSRFVRASGGSPVFFALLGYAVLDDAAMPIVGDPETMNDTFVEQAVLSARAAIEELDRRGVGDPARVGVGGHSYGAFMTACLLAHSTLFSAGIARSGAYNRTLTPFGFQAERRTLWEAPESYRRLSPFLSAHTIRAPLLLIHGEKDDNPGTHYVQSERLFQAIKGTGGRARFVSLPHEGHGYHARESILHVLAEQIAWFDEHLNVSRGT